MDAITTMLEVQNTQCHQRHMIMVPIRALTRSFKSNAMCQACQGTASSFVDVPRALGKDTIWLLGVQQMVLVGTSAASFAWLSATSTASPLQFSCNHLR